MNTRLTLFLHIDIWVLFRVSLYFRQFVALLVKLFSEARVATKILFEDIIQSIFLLSTSINLIIDTLDDIFMAINVFSMNSFEGVELIECGSYSLLLCLFDDDGGGGDCRLLLLFNNG